MEPVALPRIVLDVLGAPAPKGSGRAINVAGHAQHVASGSDANARALRTWDAAVRNEAKRVVGEVTAPPFVKRPLRLTIVFRLRRPSGHYGKNGQIKRSAPLWPTTKPDLSKLLRSTEDSLKGIVWDDDAKVVEGMIRKRYALPGEEGARIVVEALADTPST